MRINSLHPPDNFEIIDGFLTVVPYDQAASNQLFTSRGIFVMPAVEKFIDGDIGVMAESGGVHKVDIVFIISNRYNIMSLLPLRFPIYSGFCPCLHEEYRRFPSVDHLPEVIDCHAAALPHLKISLLRISKFPVGKAKNSPVAGSPMRIRTKDSCQLPLTIVFTVVEKDRL